MELVFVRVDNRLIHGQVSTAWVTHTGTNRIIIVNDQTAKNPLERSILGIAKPRSIRKLEILSVTEAAKVIKNDTSNDRVMIIGKTPHDIKGLVDEGIAIKEINLGNMPSGPDKTRYSNTVYADAGEVEVIKEMVLSGINIYAQATPASNKVIVNV